MLPEHLESILDQWHVRPETKARLTDAYLALGPAVLEVFASMVEGFDSPAAVLPEDLDGLQAIVVDRYLRQNHPQWLDGKATASLWHPREAEGRAAGMVVPLGPIGIEVTEGFPAEVESIAWDALAPGQPVPHGILLLGRNAHFGGRSQTVSFDVVVDDLDEALAVALAEGRQHTLPGSVGETSGSIDLASGIGLIWEVQPNVLKPAGEVNRNISRIYRKHRNWHLVTLIAAMAWMRSQGLMLFVVRGTALRAAHEVNPHQPISETIMGLHDQTVARATEALGARLEVPQAEESGRIMASSTPNTGLRRLMESDGVEAAVKVVRG